MKILLPVDGSPQSLSAVTLVVRLVGEGLQASVVLANVQEPASLYEMLRLHDSEAIERMAASAGEHALAAATALVERAGIDYESEVCSGDPAHTIVDLVERYGCDAVVMGARGLGAGRSAPLGSVANEVLHATQVPVTIVKGGGAADPANDLMVEAAPEAAPGSDAA
jgi:nucleotide-binding universal stress UspA family protein